jgi:hypothetical protein
MVKFSKRLIDISGMRNVVQRRIPVLTLDSGRPGPKVWLSGCIHGDEPGGAAIIHDVVSAARESGMTAGAIHALPIINSMGFENVSRYVNSDREDLNRCFPGNPGGTMGERIARRLFDLIRTSQPDLVIDLHNDWIQSVPYVLIESRREFRQRGLRKRTIEAARATGLLMVQESGEATEMSRSLTGAMVAHGIPAFTIEAGGACGVVEQNVGSGTAAVLGVLRQLGIIDTGPGDGSRSTAPDVLDYTSRPKCTSSGLVRFMVTPGDQVKAHAIVAKVFSAFGSVEETLRAEQAGFILGVADHARAVPGSEVIAIAQYGSQE